MRWFSSGDGRTPLDPDEAAGLLLPAVSRGELNELEQVNITEGLRWAYGRPQLAMELLSVHGLLTLHRRLFGDVWSWAGQFRLTEKNLGVAPEQVGPALKTACDDAAFWIGEGGRSPCERAALFHHRLVGIHAFANGNGRHARVVADLLLHHGGHAALTWPTDRARYIDALRAADSGRHALLLELLIPRAADQRPS